MDSALELTSELGSSTGSSSTSTNGLLGGRACAGRMIGAALLSAAMLMSQSPDWTMLADVGSHDRSPIMSERVGSAGDRLTHVLDCERHDAPHTALVS
jgi:hypothetical protein